MHGAQPIAITGLLLYNMSIGCQFSPARRGYGSSGMSHGFSKEASRCRIEEALDIGLHQIAISSVLQIEGEVADRIQRTASGSIAVTTLQKILLIDCR